MISRKTTLVLARVYTRMFTGFRSNSHTGTSRLALLIYAFHDFLFEHDYPGWLCSRAQRMKDNELDAIKTLITEIHTGQAFARFDSALAVEEQRKQGQGYLLKLAEDFLNLSENSLDNLKQELETSVKVNSQGGIRNKLMSLGNTKRLKEEIAKLEGDSEALLRSLELDGYIYHSPKILTPESNVLDTEEEIGVLESLYLVLQLDNKDTTFHCLDLSEKHYLDGNWDDCVSNARRFLESVLREVAVTHSLNCKGIPLSTNVYEKPVLVRDYLEREGLVEPDEKETIAKVYGLLSGVGSHPYIAQSDQARLLRNLALTIAQFTMLRLKGCLDGGCH
jgi:hypothetical protein